MLSLKKVEVIVERQSRCALEVNKCVMELLGYWEFPYQSSWSGTSLVIYFETDNRR